MAWFVAANLSRNIAFHPTSVLFETANHAELVEKVGVRSLISGVMDELLQIATAQGCQFGTDFKDKTIEAMTRPQEANSTMYQDFAAKRPMEVETYLGSPMKLAQEVNVPVPRIETVYAMLHHINIVNQQRPAATPVSPQQNGGHPPRMSSAPMPRGPPPNGMNGHPMKGSRPGSRAPSVTGGPAPMMRRGPPPNGFPPGPPGRPPMGNGYGPPGPPMQRRGSFEGNDLEEFSHLMLYDAVPEDGDMPGNGVVNGGPYPMPEGNMSNGDMALRERELALRQKELALREREYHMRAAAGPRRPMPPASHAGDFDEEDDGDFFDPMGARAPAMIDPDNFDMMSVTSRRTRKAPSAQQLRKNPEMGGPPPMANGRGGPRGFGRPGMNKRTSARLMSDVPGLHDSIMNNALIGYSSDRYGNVDRANMGQQSRTNSLTAARLDEMAGPGYGAYPQGRRASQSPGNPLSPGRGRPSPPGGYPPYANGQPNGRPSPPGMRQPVPRHPPGHGNAVAPQQVEQHVGVSNPQSKRGPQVRSLTGSASASAESGDSGASALVDSEPSAASSQSSLGPRPPIGVR